MFYSTLCTKEDTMDEFIIRLPLYACFLMTLYVGCEKIQELDTRIVGILSRLKTVERELLSLRVSDSSDDGATGGWDKAEDDEEGDDADETPPDDADGDGEKPEPVDDPVPEDAETDIDDDKVAGWDECGEK